MTVAAVARRQIDIRGLIASVLCHTFIAVCAASVGPTIVPVVLDTLLTERSSSSKADISRALMLVNSQQLFKIKVTSEQHFMASYPFYRRQCRFSAAH